MESLDNVTASCTSMLCTQNMQIEAQGLDRQNGSSKPYSYVTKHAEWLKASNHCLIRAKSDCVAVEDEIR